MAPVLTLYILGGCVAVAALLFIIMIAMSVSRAPRLPPLSIHSPMQRVMRALTPPPFAFDEAPTTAVPRVAKPFEEAATNAVHRVPPPRAVIGTAPVIPAPTVFAPSPFNWSVPVAAPRAVSRPPYPTRRRSRKLLWFFVGLFVTTTLAAGALVAYPPLLDPLCDDYEWIGAETAQVIRDYAWQANPIAADIIDQVAR